MDATPSQTPDLFLSKEIIAAIIGVTGIIVAALITAYATEIKSLITRFRNRNDLVGDWKCEWTVEHPEDFMPRKFEDVIKISKCTGKRVEGLGINPMVGTYVVEGRSSPFALSLSFYNKGPNEDSVGVILLKKSTNKNKMVGQWNQLVMNHEIAYGETTWTKI